MDANVQAWFDDYEIGRGPGQKACAPKPSAPFGPETAIFFTPLDWGNRLSSCVTHDVSQHKVKHGMHSHHWVHKESAAKRLAPHITSKPHLDLSNGSRECVTGTSQNITA